MAAAWARRASRAVAGIAPRSGAVNLVIVDDREIRRLNRRYRGKDKPTDVLSFAYDGVEGVVGDVFLSRQTLARDAARLGVEPAHLSLRLVIHGCLHVSGYDHETDAEAERMERRERVLLRRVLPPGVVSGLF
jgi:probable rRNA maturation factor